LLEEWQVPALDIAGWVIDGEIALSAVLPTVGPTSRSPRGYLKLTARKWWLCSGATAHRENRRWYGACAVRRELDESGSHARLMALLSSPPM
jgi:hypothetical protein